MKYIEIVKRAYSELLHGGKVKKRGMQEEVEEDKGLITRRAGYYINQIDPEIGILEKKTGNNSKGFSVDILISKNGDYWDVVSDRDGIAFVVDGGTQHDVALRGRWAKPTAELAGLEEQSPDEDEEEEKKILKLIEELKGENAALEAENEALISRVESQAKDIRNKNLQITMYEMDIDELKKGIEELRNLPVQQCEIQPSWGRRLGFKCVPKRG